MLFNGTEIKKEGFIMSDKILDCSGFNEQEFECVKRGLSSMFSNTNKRRYFGYVDKKELKKLNRLFHYTDKCSFVKGGIVVAGVIWAGSKVKKHIDEHKAVEESVQEEES